MEKENGKGVRWMFRLAVDYAHSLHVGKMGFWVGVIWEDDFVLMMFLSIVARIHVFICPIRDAFNDSYFQHLSSARSEP